MATVALIASGFHVRAQAWYTFSLLVWGDLGFAVILWPKEPISRCIYIYLYIHTYDMHVYIYIYPHVYLHTYAGTYVLTCIHIPQAFLS